MLFTIAYAAVVALLLFLAILDHRRAARLARAMHDAAKVPAQEFRNVPAAPELRDLSAFRVEIVNPAASPVIPDRIAEPWIEAGFDWIENLAHTPAEVRPEEPPAAAQALAAETEPAAALPEPKVAPAAVLPAAEEATSPIEMPPVVAPPVIAKLENELPPAPSDDVARFVVDQLFRAGFVSQLQESAAGADIWVKRPGEDRHSVKITVGTGAAQPVYGLGAPLTETDPAKVTSPPGQIVVQLPRRA